MASTCPQQVVRAAMQAIAGVNAVACLIGMIGLVAFDGMGLPDRWLDETIFASWVWPGVILGLGVGGVQVLAVVAQRIGLRVAWGLHAVAGLVMMTWVFVEIAILTEWAPLQGVFFAAGVAQTALAVLALGAWPRPFLDRTQSDVAVRDDVVSGG